MDDDRFLRLRDENTALKKECNEQKLIIKRYRIIVTVAVTNVACTVVA